MVDQEILFTLWCGLWCGVVCSMCGYITHGLLFQAELRHRRPFRPERPGGFRRPVRPFRTRLSSPSQARPVITRPGIASTNTRGDSRDHRDPMIHKVGLAHFSLTSVLNILKIFSNVLTSVLNVLILVLKKCSSECLKCVKAHFTLSLYECHKCLKVLKVFNSFSNASTGVFYVLRNKDCLKRGC